MTEDKMVGWHHRLNGHEFEQALGDGEGQVSLACCILCSQKEKDKYCILTHVYRIQKEGTDEPIFRAAVEMQVQRRDLWTQWGTQRVGQIERIAWKHVHYQYVKQIASDNLLCKTGS